MFDVIKKSLLAGIGMMAITEEKVQSVIDEFVEKGKLTQQEIFQYISLAYQRFYYNPRYLFTQLYRGVTRNDYSLLIHGLKFLFMLRGRMNS